MANHIKSLWKAPVPDFTDSHQDRVLCFMGLHLCEVSDLLTGELDPNYRVVALENSGETLLVLLCDEDRAFEIATDMAYKTDWTKVADWDGLSLLPAQIEMIARYPGEAVPPLMPETEFPDWEDEVPYGSR